MNTGTNRTAIRPAGAWARALCAICSLVIYVGSAHAAKPASSAISIVETDASANSISVTADSDASLAQGVQNPDAPDFLGCALTVLPGGTGTSGNSRAPNPNFLNSHAVWLITAAEAAAGGLANGATPGAIGFRYSTAPSAASTGTLKVYLMNTSDTTYNLGLDFSTAIAGMTLVSNAAATLPASTTAFDITFSGGSPFTYTGGGIYLAFQWQYAGPARTLTVVDCNTTLTNGLAGNNDNTSTMLASNFRPLTRLSPTVGSAHDASVDAVMAYGSLVQPQVGTQAVQALVVNKGTLGFVNLAVTLNITGAETFSNVQTIASLGPCGGQAVVTFAPFTPSAIGSDTLRVSVPNDDVLANNSKSRPLDETYSLYSYKYPGSSPDGGVGFTNGTGTVAAKFNTTVATKVTAVIMEFFSVTPTAYRVAIYADSGSGTPGAQLYLDAADRTVLAPGPVTIPVGPIAVGPGNFFVGFEQTNTTNASFSFDNENPLRTGKFYASAVPPVTWADLAPAGTFKLNIGINLQCTTAAACNDNNSCTDDACDSVLGCTHTNNNANSCTDGNPCTIGDLCSGGTCQPGTNPCNDQDACTNDICDGQGGCTYIAVNCDDSNVCTDDSCNPASGCAHVNNTNSCNADNNICTVGDACSNGVCVAGPAPQPVQFCSQGLITINDSPTPPALASPYPSTITVSGLAAYLCSVTVDLNGINHAFPDDIDILLARPAGGPNAIIMSDVGGGVAASGLNLNLADAASSFLPDAGPLVSGSFKPTNVTGTGTEAWPAPAPAPLGGSALSAFTGTDPNGTWNLFVVDDETLDGGTIDNGWCINLTVLSSCTIDADCNDNDACTSDTCVNSHCLVLPVSCDDSNACTDDFCDSQSGCQHANNQEPCDDNSACTELDACANGACTGQALVCNDFNACTLDTCNPASGCVFTDNSASCNDNNGCTNDSCNPGTGCAHANNTNACDDGNPCTAGDVCGGGSCQPGTPVPPPGEVQGVAVAADKVTYSWTATPGATGYDVVRGRIGALPVGPGGGDEVPFCGLASNSLVEPSPTAPADSLFYISRAKNACGNGTYGTQSNGSPRITTTCP